MEFLGPMLGVTSVSGIFAWVNKTCGGFINNLKYTLGLEEKQI